MARSEQGFRAMNPIRLLALLALVAVACQGPSTPEPQAGIPPADENGVGPEPAIALTGECVNDEDGYTVPYPASWHSNRGEILAPCSLFDPAPIDVPANSEIPIDIAIMIDLEPVAFATVTAESLGRQDRSRERTSVDGREALRVDAESTGQGLYDAGLQSRQYFVDLGDRTLIATTWDAGSVPFERKKDILDAMMARLEIR